MKIAITGRPGIGKTTVFMRTVECLRSTGLKVGGIVCPEVRERGVRVGFKVVDLMTGREGWLASVYSPSPIRISKYGVNVEEFEEIGVEAVHRALGEADVIAVDEVGPMELKSLKFKQILDEVLASRKPALLVVHWKLQGQFVQEVRRKAEVRVVEVTLYNRDKLPLELCRMLRG